MANKLSPETLRIDMDNWIDVEDRRPNQDTKVWFWLVPKLPEESPHDSSGNPITAYGKLKPYMRVCKWNCWSGLEKPTHWQPLPEPPSNSDEINKLAAKVVEVVGQDSKIKDEKSIKAWADRLALNCIGK